MLFESWPYMSRTRFQPSQLDCFQQPNTEGYVDGWGG